MKQILTKQERLSSKKVIGRLFEKGSAATRTFYLFPFRVLYIADDEERTDELPAILITISRRNFKKAVDRNLIRRRTREAYRKNKPLLLGTPEQPKQPPAYIAFLYTAREKISFEEIEKSVKLALSKVGSKR